MNLSPRTARTISLAVLSLAALGSSDISGAAASQNARGISKVAVQDAAGIMPAATFVSNPVIQPLPAPDAQPKTDLVLEESAPITGSSLVELVKAQPQPAELSRELQCLAGAIYFESRSEPLAGQLAVGRVVVSRSKSGRFPNSYCGVVYQPSQFSFVRGNSMPSIKRGSRQWRNAVAIAQIAHAGTWRSEAEGALYFHAARVSPGWRHTRVARIQNHVFYR